MAVSYHMDWLVMLAIILHLAVAPFTKVEESFNVQAIHDILYKRTNLSAYDHLEFPGVVPRTFIGPLAIAALSSPVVLFMDFFDWNKIWALVLGRSILGLLVVLGMRLLRESVERKFGLEVAIWSTCVVISQFHPLYYASRTLPNIFALVLVLVALHYWLDGDGTKFLISSGAGIIFFRSELALLLGLYLLDYLARGKFALKKLATVCIPAGLILVGCTLMVDTLFWGRVVWPEFEVFWFNAVLNKSSEWGTSPFSWYFYSALPRAMGASVLLLPFAFLDAEMRRFLLPAVGYVLLYSFLPHKELRFIIYVVPIFDIGVGLVCKKAWRLQASQPNRLKSAVAAACWGHFLINLIFTGFLLNVSSKNYPGGMAMVRLHEIVDPDSDVHVHIGNFAAQSGVSRFLELNPLWRYNKTENLSFEEMERFTHLLMESKDWEEFSDRKTFEVLDVITCFSRVHFNYKSFPPFEIRTRPCIFIVERASGRINDRVSRVQEMIDES